MPCWLTPRRLMMTKPKFIIGDELFVRNPTRYLKGCVSITGDVVEIESIGSSFKYWVMAEVVYPSPRQHWHGRIAIFEVDLYHRIGIPLSQQIGRETCREWGCKYVE